MDVAASAGRCGRYGQDHGAGGSTLRRITSLAPADLLTPDEGRCAGMSDVTPGTLGFLNETQHSIAWCKQSTSAAPDAEQVDPALARELAASPESTGLTRREEVQSPDDSPLEPRA